MKAVMLYRPNTELARQAEVFAHDFKRIKGYDVELIDLNTRPGADMARLYDVMQYPSVLVIRDDGQLIKCWQGDQLPLMSEVASYLV